MHPDIVKLLELQSKDVELLEADKGLDAVLAEVQALDHQLIDAEKAKEQAHRAVADAQKRRKEVEAKVDTYKKLEERGKARMDSVKTPKELQAVNAELDLARQMLAKEEAEWLKLAEVLAAAETVAREADSRLQQMRDAQGTARGALDLKRVDAEGVRNKALEARDAAAAEVNRALRTRYERLRSVKSVYAVVALSGPACGACNTAIPLNRRSQIRAGTLIDACESCGVILFAAEETVE
jgi:predicted  nucleic acid-binding Zn-ribbon protein